MQENKKDNRKRSNRKTISRKSRGLILAALFVALGIVGTVLIVKLTPTSRHMGDSDYFGTMEADEAAIILGDEKIDERAVMVDDALYLPYSIVRDTLNERFYWDGSIAKMLFTTASQEFEIPVNSTSYSVTDGVRTSDPVSQGTYDRVVVLRPEDGRITGANETGLYISADFLQQYSQVEYTFTKAEKTSSGKKDGKETGAGMGHVLIRYQWGDALMSKTLKETAVRYQGGIKSPILTKLAKGESVLVLEELKGWTKVLTDNGYIGYVKKSRITQPETENVTTDLPAQEYPSLALDEKVALVWHQISTEDGNSTFADATEGMSGINVISPTWFSLTDNDGNVSSIGSKKYVKQAHKAGLSVWGLVSDFSSDMDTSAVLASTAARRNIIGQLVDYAEELGLDGINLDFEYMEEADALAYTQFIRELSIECRLKKLVFSVDMKPPYDFNAWMNRREIGTVADYLINMGYDEHYAGSEPGSVASLPYEERAVKETIAQGVPAEKIISAVPFYTRIWYSSKGEDGSENVSSEVLSMGSTEATLDSWSLTPEWDAESFQHYADWTTGDGVRCRIWIEDETSLAAKIRLVPKYGLGGTAAWALGFQTSDAWNAISSNLNLSEEEAKSAQEEAEEEAAGEPQADPDKEETEDQTEGETEAEK